MINLSLARAYPPTAYIAFAAFTHSVMGAFDLGSKFCCALPQSCVFDFRTFCVEVVAVTGLALHVARTLVTVRK